MFENRVPTWNNIGPKRKDIYLDQRIILRWNLERWDGGGMDWIDLAQDKDQWRTLLNTILNLLIPWNIGKFLNSCATGGFSRSA
jgi:hypothetical protein